MKKLSSQVKSTNNSYQDEILFLLLNYLSVFQYLIIGFLHFLTSDRFKWPKRNTMKILFMRAIIMLDVYIRLLQYHLETK